MAAGRCCERRPTVFSPNCNGYSLPLQTRQACCCGTGGGTVPPPGGVKSWVFPSPPDTGAGVALIPPNWVSAESVERKKTFNPVLQPGHVKGTSGKPLGLNTRKPIPHFGHLISFDSIRVLFLRLWRTAMDCGAPQVFIRRFSTQSGPGPFLGRKRQFPFRGLPCSRVAR